MQMQMQSKGFIHIYYLKENYSHAFKAFLIITASINLPITKLLIRNIDILIHTFFLMQVAEKCIFQYFCE